MAVPSRVSRPRAVPWIVGAATLLALGAVSTAFDGRPGNALANLTYLLVALGGALGCGRAARRTAGRARRGWTAMAVACGAWAGGQAAWTAYEDVFRVEVPILSVADLGYLGFPVAALIGLVQLAPPAPRLEVPRRVLDALMVGCAIGLLAWLTVLGTVLAGPAGGLGLAVAVSYPVLDVVLVTVTVLTLARTREEPLRWALLGGGILALAVSDAAYAYQVAVDRYAPDSAVAWGWRGAFCLIGIAGALVVEDRAKDRPAERTVAPRAGPLPYLPLVVAFLVAGGETVRTGGLDTVAVVLVVALVLLVLVRQYLTVRANQELAHTVQQREVQLHRLAFHDGLTGLANRALFLDRLEHALDLAGRTHQPVSVAFLDLDGFKAVNDTLGHAGGDALLVRVAERLRGALRPADTVARLGGDEFAVLVEQGDDAAAVGYRLLDALRAPFRIDGRTVSISASVGVATVEPPVREGLDHDTGARASRLLHRADVAMYAAKHAGKGDVTVHTPVLDITVAGDEAALDRAFAAALQRGEVHALYQPAVDPVTGRIGAFEALARWTHEGVEVPPSVFVPICARAGLSEQLTALMLDRACTQLAAWNLARGDHHLRMAVNVNPAEFSDEGLPDRVAELIDRHRLAHGQLVLEITEVAAVNRPETTYDVMTALQKIGVRLSIDDFGTGYSSLVRLARAPVDTVKIDQSFVVDIDHDERQRRFMLGLLDLARHLDLRTVVEGVERPGQLRELRRQGCYLVQGHLIARPAPADEFTAVVLADRPILPPHLLG